VDVLGHALAFPLLGLDDPEAHGRRRVVIDQRRLVACVIGGVQVAPQDVQLASDHVHPLQPALEAGELAAVRLVLGAKRIGPNRSERPAAAVDASTKLHPLLQVAPILLAELLRQLVHAAGFSPEMLARFSADAVEPPDGGSPLCFVRHGLP